MLTIDQYKESLMALFEGKKRKDILIRLYKVEPVPDNSILAKMLGYPNHNTANLQIGSMGRAISQYLGKEPDGGYSHKGIWIPSYFSFIHVTDGQNWEMVENLRRAMENLQWVSPDEAGEILPTELVLDLKAYKEGQLMPVYVNRYERNKKAKEACLKVHGRICKGCHMDFKKIYGNDVNDIIHVHHIKPLKTIKKAYQVNPKTDLVPLCPNCHAVVHTFEKELTIEQLRQRVQKAKKEILA